MISAAVCTWTSTVAGEFQWKVLLVALLVFGLCVWIGACLLASLSSSDDSTNPVVAILIGYFGLSVALFLGTVVCHLDILVSLLLSVGLAALLILGTRQRSPVSRLRLDLLDYAALAVAIVFTTLWSSQNLEGVRLTPQSATSIPWYDTFHHSFHISHFSYGSGRTLGTDPLLAIAPLSPYHYAGYVIPSLFVRAAGALAYAETLGHFAPFGTLCASLSAYAIGRVLAGSLGGLCAVVLCAALPDPSFYLLENRWVSYYFFQQIASNGALGASLMGLGWAFCLHAVKKQQRRWTVVGLVLGLCVSVFKSQVFLTYSGGLLLFAAVTLPRLPTRARAPLGLTAMGLYAAGAFGLLPRIPRAPTFQMGTTAGPMNLHFALSNVGGHCQACITELSKHYVLFLAVAVPAFLLFMFGILVPMIILMVSSRRIRLALPTLGWWLLGVVVVNFLLVTLGLEANDGFGDPFEIAHKTFVWPYVAIAAWCGCALAKLVDLGRPLTRQVVLTAIVPLSLIASAKVVHDCSNNLQTGFVYVGSEKSAHITVPRSIYDTAAFLRTRTPRDAIIQTSIVGEHLFLHAIAERRTYCGYPLSSRNAPPLTRTAHVALGAMLAAPSPEALREIARSTHIDYFVLYPGQQPAWASAMNPVYQSGEVRVYQI